MICSNFKTSQTGFTLIEIVITLAMVAIMATIAAITYFNRDPYGIAENSMQQMESTIDLARAYAVTGQECCSGVVPQGYGMYIELDGVPDQTYFLYADVNGDEQYTVGSDEIIQSDALESDVHFTQCTMGATIISPPGNCDVFMSRTALTQELYFNGVLVLKPDTITIRAEHDDAPTQPVIHEIFPHSLVVQ